MKRIYFTAVPLPSNFVINTQHITCDNIRLRTDDALFFPISRLMEATMRPGDEAVLIAIRQTNNSGDENMKRLRQDLATLRFRCQIKEIIVPENQKGDTLMELFKQMAVVVPPKCCLYADSTFGTKTYPILLFTALHYAEKIKECEVKYLVYQEQRRDAQTHQVKDTSLYDVTSLFYLNGVVDALCQSEADVEEKDSMLASMLAGI